MPPFPHEAVRDLIGIASAMYAVEQSVPRRAELAVIGKALRAATNLARRPPEEQPRRERPQ
jgi:hypothetical protein